MITTEITAQDVSIHDELLVEGDHINAYLDVWFDAAARFGLTRLLGGDDYINLYADYYPKSQRLNVYCVVKYADGSDSKPIPLSDMSRNERAVVMGVMRDAGLDKYAAEMLCAARQRGGRAHRHKATTKPPDTGAL